MLFFWPFSVRIPSPQMSITTPAAPHLLPGGPRNTATRLLWTMISDHHRSDRGAGDVRPHGRGHRQGLSDLIREEFGLRLTFVLMVLLVVVNYTNVVTEFIGIAGRCTFSM